MKYKGRIVPLVEDVCLEQVCRWRKGVSRKHEDVKIVPLGGFGEVGKNSFLIEVGQDMLMVDCGVIFPNKEEHPGVARVIPDFSYVVKNQKRLRGLVITHGHEDHIGAIPFFLQQLGVTVPIYATKFTAGLIHKKLEEYSLKAKIIELNPDRDQVVKITEKLSFEPYRVTHSIPDAVGFAFRTPMGLIVHTGDFKMDNSPVDGRTTDLDKLYRFRQEGVLAMISDTVSAHRPGVSLSEKEVGRHLREHIVRSTGGVIVGCFASNIHRIQQIIEASLDAGKRVVINGFSMERNIITALETGVLRVPASKLLSSEEWSKGSHRDTVVITTGSQGEPLGGLKRIATGTSHQIELRAGDTVILSATPIPGNEKDVNTLINELLAKDAHVIHPGMGASVHTSGHGHAEELKWMLRLLRPRYVIPFHGEEIHVRSYTAIAEMLGYGKERVLRLSLGDVLTFDRGKPYIRGGFEAGTDLVDGSTVGMSGRQLLRERMHMRDEGVVIAVVEIGPRREVKTAEVVTRGVFYNEADRRISRQAKRALRTATERFLREKNYQSLALKAELTIALKNFFHKELGRRPMVIPFLLD